jgi:hypothetical protein
MTVGAGMIAMRGSRNAISAEVYKPCLAFSVLGEHSSADNQAVRCCFFFVFLFRFVAANSLSPRRRLLIDQRLCVRKHIQ